MKNYKKIISIMLLLSLMLTFFLPLTVSAEKSSSYTDVLDDLEKDDSFNPALYGSNPTDYSIKFIQVAEGENGELYVYAYQPSNDTLDLTASYINMSTKHYEDEKQNYKLYRLSLVSTNGVFDKYLVNNFTVSDDAYRYYNISTIYRSYNVVADGASLPGSGDTVGHKGYDVGKFIAAYNSGNTVLYEAKDVDVVDVDITSVGIVRYSNGIKFSNTTTKCDSHFVAFDITNYDVTNIFSATVTYTIADCVINYGVGLDSTPKLSNEQTFSIDIYDYEKGCNTGDGIRGHKYEWPRIQTFDEFDVMLKEYDHEKIVYEEEKITSSDYVFSFLETDFDIISGNGFTTYMSDRVTDVGILRLHFATDTGVYNLGVVSDLVSDDGEPDVEIGFDDDYLNNQREWEDALDLLFSLVLTLTLLVGLIIVNPLLKPLFSMIGKGFKEIFNTIIGIIFLPFRLIGQLFRSKN